MGGLRRRHGQSKREKRFESGSYFVEHLHRSSANEARPALLPRDASQLIGLDNTANLPALPVVGCENSNHDPAALSDRQCADQSAGFRSVSPRWGRPRGNWVCSVLMRCGAQVAQACALIALWIVAASGCV
jgi:hypothetical protein